MNIWNAMKTIINIIIFKIKIINFDFIVIIIVIVVIINAIIVISKIVIVIIDILILIFIDFVCIQIVIVITIEIIMIIIVIIGAFDLHFNSFNLSLIINRRLLTIKFFIFLNVPKRVKPIIGSVVLLKIKIPHSDFYLHFYEKLVPIFPMISLIFGILPSQKLYFVY